MIVNIREFSYSDINKKLEWINNPSNNKYLHYDLPLEYDKTVKWFNNLSSNRYDCVIEVNNIPVGLIGLLSIDDKRKNAEYYISMGETSYKGKGVGYKATKLILDYGFNVLGLKNIYLFTEVDNIPAQKLFTKSGFNKLNRLDNNLIYNGKPIKRYIFNISRNSYYIKKNPTPINFIDDLEDNKIYIKRDDLIQYSFGGNKTRKAVKFFEEIDNFENDYVVTYGSSHSNHCRVVANLAAKRNLPCLIISPEEVADTTYNSKLMKLLGADIVTVPVNRVSETIDSKIENLKQKGYNPYFIPGGGHGNLGTQAYLECYQEIKKYENDNNINFDYIFLASGTGTTQAGLICGKILNNDDTSIIGISIARKNPRGRKIVKDSVKGYLPNINEDVIERNTIFIDDYTSSGYGKYDKEISDTIKECIIQYGIPMDSTYTAKAYLGMKKYLEKNNIRNENILFIHTGGTPLFFDDLRNLEI